MIFLERLPFLQCVFSPAAALNICFFFLFKDPRDRTNYDRISKLLIENGADVNAVNAHDITVLHEVAQYGETLPQIKYFLCIEFSYFMNRFFAQLGYDKVAEMILNNGGSKIVNHKAHSGSPLCYAAYFGAYNDGHDRIVKLLIEHGADVNQRCDDKSTPLHSAIYKSTNEGVQGGFIHHSFLK